LLKNNLLIHFFNARPRVITKNFSNIFPQIHEATVGHNWLNIRLRTFDSIWFVLAVVFLLLLLYFTTCTMFLTLLFQISQHLSLRNGDFNGSTGCAKQGPSFLIYAL